MTFSAGTFNEESKSPFGTAIRHLPTRCICIAHQLVGTIMK